MANSPQSKKRARQNTARSAQHAAMRSRMRTAVKKVRKTIEKSNITEAGDQLPLVFSILDRYARKGLIKKNKANRLKSRIHLQIKARSRADGARDTQ